MLTPSKLCCNGQILGHARLHVCRPCTLVKRDGQRSILLQIFHSTRSMLIPITSDAELRYWPFATGIIILLNIAAFITQQLLPPYTIYITPDPSQYTIDEWEYIESYLDENGGVWIEGIEGYLAYALSHGAGLQPIQWLTSFFIHADVMHLLGNMVFLWVFGHIVEGVVGSWKFAALYVGMGVLQNIIEQILFLGTFSPPSLGASSAIYAIMLLAAWFSPHDNVQCILILFIRLLFIKVPVLVMAGMYFVWDVLVSIYLNFQMTTALLHAMGGGIGFLVGYVLLKKGWVENDNKDALSLMRDLRGLPPATPIKTPKPDSKQELLAAAQADFERKQRIAISANSLAMHLQAGNLNALMYQLNELRRKDPRYQWEESLLLQAINLAQKKERWDEVVSLSDIYLQHFVAKANAIRLNLAKVLLLKKTLPVRALKILKLLNSEQLDEKQVATFQKLVRECQRRIDDGTLELSDD